MLSQSPYMSTTEEQIQELQLQILKLKERSVLELRVKLAEAKGLVIALEKQLEQMTGQVPVATERKARVSVTIQQIVEAIQNGQTNYRLIANQLGCSAQNVANKVKAEGKKAGIKSMGEKANFKLSVK